VCYTAHSGRTSHKLQGVAINLKEFLHALDAFNIPHEDADIATFQGYEGEVFLGTQFRSPSGTCFSDHLRLLIILHCICNNDNDVDVDV